jgi:hypothetical protein
LCPTRSLFNFSCRLLRFLGLLAFLLPCSASLFFSSYLLSLFRVSGRHFLYRGQDRLVRSILLKPPQGPVIHFEPDSVFFHELSDAIRLYAAFNQIANVIEGKHFLSEPWQRVSDQQYRQNGTPAHRTSYSRKISINFQTAMRHGIL